MRRAVNAKRGAMLELGQVFAETMEAKVEDPGWICTQPVGPGRQGMVSTSPFGGAPWSAEIAVEDSKKDEYIYNYIYNLYIYIYEWLFLFLEVTR